MKEQEKIQEEIRLLNLRVDELKAQNGHYQEATDELQAKKDNYEKEILRIQAEYGELVKVEGDMQKKIALLQKSLKEYEELLGAVKEDVSREEGKLAISRAENIRETTRRDELKYTLAELENRIKLSQNELSVKFDSLKGFEEQLLVKEGLLNQREQSLDLVKRGVKIRE